MAVTAVATLTVTLIDTETRYGITDATVALYVYGVTVTNGSISGTRAVDRSNSVIVGEHVIGGLYKFNSVPPGRYSVVISGPGYITQVLSTEDGLRVAPGADASDIALSVSNQNSIKDKLNEIIQVIRDNSGAFPSGTLPTVIT